MSGIGHLRDRAEGVVDYRRKAVVAGEVLFAGLRAWSDRVLSGPGLAALFIAIYALAYLARFPLPKWYAVPQVTFYSIQPYRFLVALSLTAAAVALVALGWRMWSLAQTLPRRAVIPLILAGWLGASLCAIFTYPGQSTDIGDYIFRGHMLAHLGRNPLTTPPSALIAWKQFSYLSWYWEPDFYGPLWQWLSVAMHRLAGENILANFLAYKLLATAAIGLCGWLIYATLARLAPGYAAAGLALWLWNPLVINAGSLDGHNDFALIALVLAGMALLLRNRWDVKPRTGSARLAAACIDVAGILLLVAAGLVKATGWVVLPVAAVWLLRSRGVWKGTALFALGLLAGVALVWLTYRPFGGWDLVLTMAQKRSWWPANTWTAALFFALRDARHIPHAVVVRSVIGGASALFAILAGIVLLRVRELRLSAWGVSLAYLLVGSHWFQPWYAALSIGLAALIPDRHVARYTLILSFFMLLYPIASPLVATWKTLPPGAYHAIMAFLVLLAPQVLAVGLAVSRLRPGRRLNVAA
ncbi:MAG: hypothetical protein ACM30E_08020 [Nitrososphaerales archaeon]